MPRLTPRERILEAARKGWRHANSIGWITFGKRSAMRGFHEIGNLVNGIPPHVLKKSDAEVFSLVLAKCKWMRKCGRLGMSKGDAIALYRNIKDIEEICVGEVQPELPGFSEVTKRRLE